MSTGTLHSGGSSELSSVDNAPVEKNESSSSELRQSQEVQQSSGGDASEVLACVVGDGKKVAITYPIVVTIGAEKVNVASKEEHEEAKIIIATIKDDYGIDVSSSKGIAAIKTQYTKVPDNIKNTLETMAWEFKELKAVGKALKHYAPVLGASRAKSSRKGEAQEITSVSKVKQAISRNAANGTLDTTTLGEYFKGTKNFGMFKAGTNSTVDFNDNEKQLEATVIHEIGHGIFAHKYNDWATSLEFWTDVFTKSGKVGAEIPATTYGKKNAREDLCEALMYFFLEPISLETNCPKRHALLKGYVEEWTK